MNIQENYALYPDVSRVPSELSLVGGWDSTAVAALIRAKSDHGQTPAFLFLGKTEAALLKKHLTEAWGPEAVVTLKHCYYMGLEVVTIDCESFLSTGGRKVIQTLQDPISRRAAWREGDADILWQFRM